MPQRDPIAEIIEEKSPTTAVFIGPTAAPAAASFRERHPQTQVSVYDGGDPLAEVEAIGRVDLAVVTHALEMMDKTRARHLLAALRDLHSKCLIVAVRLGDNWPGLHSHWHENELLAFGMRKRARIEQGEQTLGVYEFNLQDYKLNPDWLNPRHWAHPELWDVYRW